MSQNALVWNLIVHGSTRSVCHPPMIDANDGHAKEGQSSLKAFNFCGLIPVERSASLAFERWFNVPYARG